MIFLVAITALSSLNAEAGSARARVRFTERALTGEALIVYAATTEPMNLRGIAIGGVRFEEDMGDGAFTGTKLARAEIFLDGRPYSTDVQGPIALRLQDQGGLVNLATLDDRGFGRLAALLGMNTESVRGLRARTMDYTDSDALEQINGAEKSKYGSATIANRTLRRPSEWLSVLGIRNAVQGRAWQRLKTSITADPAAPYWNVNTATPTTLRVLLGMTDREIEASIRERGQRPLTSLSDLGAAAGMALTDDPEQIYTFPNGKIVFEIRDGRSRWTYRGRVVLTPSRPERPFWVDQHETLETPDPTGTELSNAEPFPYAAN
ncbi:hypothetical protein [Brevundimonas sp. TWP2-3-4b1]|uniref:hypothetical protein n=1 Tax=Brevundimonas sp. TWP2-3-4b1 TaxID=2804580 RepID=UPI003CEF2DEE